MRSYALGDAALADGARICAHFDPWHSFESVDLEGVFVYGVYVIWKPGSVESTPSRRNVRVRCFSSNG